MSTIAELSPESLHELCSGPGLALDFGAARARVRTRSHELQTCLQRSYGAFPATEADGFFHVSASVEPVGGLRRLFRPQIRFVVDGQQPFEPFPADTHAPLLEWGINFCLADRLNHHLLLHAGTLELEGVGILLPGVPGAGKSTLTAALSSRGFRLLSDEFGVVRLADGRLLPMVRPAALKNASIDVMRRWSPDSVFGPVFPRTRKGDVCHMAPNVDSVLRRNETVAPGLIVFPRFQEGADAQLRAVEPGRAFARLALHSFNYQTLGPRAFEAVAHLVRTCRYHELVYGRLEDARRVLEGLVTEVSSGGASALEAARYETLAEHS